MSAGQRQSSFELLRIIVMLIIVAYHFSVHGKFEFPTNVININRIWILFMSLGGKLGVNIFVMISGYFLVEKSELKMEKIFRLYIQIFTYSVVLYAFFVFTGMESFGLKSLCRSLFPIIFSQWWFASTYVFLYLISQFINKFLINIDKRDYLKMLVLLTVCWSIIPTFSTSNFQCNNLLWFVYLYALAGYLRLYADIGKLSGKACFMLTIVIALLTFFLGIFLVLLGIKFPFLGERATYFWGQQSMPILLTSVLLFLGFKKLNLGYSRIVNTIAATTFGIYLLHDHPYVRTFLWSTVFRNATFSDSSLLIPYSIGTCFLVFVGGMLIELFRMYVLERNYMPFINKIVDLLDSRLKQFFDMLMQKI